MKYDLPSSVEIDGVSHNIRKRGDFRVVLDSIAALNDLDLKDEEKLYCATYIFYEDCNELRDMKEAVRQMMIFINLGEEESDSKPRPQLMDWEQDFKIIVAPINRVVGQEIRSMEYLHWWTFISAYYEIGECCFSTVVSLREKQRKGKKLEKWEREYIREHSDLVKLKKRVSSEEQALIDELLC